MVSDPLLPEILPETIRILAAESLAPKSLASIATSGECFPDELELARSIGTAILVTDLAILFDAGSSIKPIPFLRRLARTGPRIAVWPGHAEGDRLAYGQVGSRHRFEWKPANVVLLTPVGRAFPDEMPFLERWVP